MIEPAIAAYAAGLVDGDGCITVNKKSRKSGNVYHSITVSIVQVDDICIQWMLRHFGGSYCKYQPKKENRQPCYRWSVDFGKAAIFLQAILPFLVQKSERAKTALQIQETMTPVKYGHNGKTAYRLQPSKEIIEKREFLFNRLRELNKTHGRNHFESKKEIN